ncbi:sodium:alanine symporter family protein [Candidatus Woesearchaeota archaeon]|nr:sodium:alanine symporter family protein [Candidatus Woesearchaeota archaeon]
MTNTDIIIKLGDFIWSYPLPILLLGTGIILTIALKGMQFRHLGHALKMAFSRHKDSHKQEGDISHFQALMTALAATVGTGNIVGVATAIAIGGPGALFWMWITGLLGMATKFTESFLGIKYRMKNKFGHMSGGPMYVMSRRLKWKYAAGFFAVMGAFAAVAVGNMIQSNSIADVINANLQIPKVVTAIVLMITVGIIILKGIHSISKVTGKLVPVMIGLYFIGAIYIVFANIELLPKAITLIIKSAFSGTAATGGFVGAGVMMTIRMGVARGLFSNESGMGSAPVVAAAAKTKNPMTQGLISMTQTFIDTIVVCTLTGLVIIITGVWQTDLNGATLTSSAFATGIPSFGNYIVLITLVLFAFSTIIGWGYYGEKFLEYLFSTKIIHAYRLFYILFVGIGALLSLKLVWAIGDIAVAFMAIPNLIALIFLAKEVRKDEANYERKKF